MLLEMHSHTSRYSRCSAVDPATLVAGAAKKGLQGIILTEHHRLWEEAEIRELRTAAGIERHFLILSAQEVDTDWGHVLVYGAGESVPGRVTVAELRARYPDAALVFAHPFRNGRRPSDEELTAPDLDAVEIFSLNQSAYENYYGLQAWHRLKFTAVCGSDTHAPENTGVFPTQFDHPVETIDDVAVELRSGRCRPFFKEIPRSGASVLATEITIGTKGEDESRRRIIVKSFADDGKWRQARKSVLIGETLHRNGFDRGMYRVPRVLESDDASRVLIEEGQRGRNLFDVVSTVSPEAGMEYFRLAARWLARLHVLRMRITPPEETVQRERRRLSRYEETFAAAGSPWTEDIRAVVRAVRTAESTLFSAQTGTFIQNHGDYHPKNIIIGRDRTHDPSTMFVSVIDFNSTLLFTPAFDVGYFLIQFKSQMHAFPDVLRLCSDRVFLETYREHAGTVGGDFERHVVLFSVRGALSIAAHLVRVGRGDSEQLRDLLSYMEVLLKNYLAPTA